MGKNGRSNEKRDGKRNDKMAVKYFVILTLAGLCLTACGNAGTEDTSGFLQLNPEIPEGRDATDAESGRTPEGAFDTGPEQTPGESSDAELERAQRGSSGSDAGKSTDGIASAALQEEAGLEPLDASGRKKEPFMIPEGAVLAERIRTPEGYVRTEAEKGSLTDFLRNYPMKEDGSSILYYNGREKKSSNHAAVFDMYLGDRDLQQCADSVMRVYAEYLRINGKQEKIAFHFVSGFLFDYKTFLDGGRIKVDGSQVSWEYGAKREDTDEVFEAYLNTVFNYASTISLAAESEKIMLDQVQPGDIFIKAGSPGHVVMVADVCVEEDTGKKAVLLAQGYMPAQDFHILKNDLHGDDPWYYEDEIVYPFRTPEYTFPEECLMRPGYLE